MELRYILSVTLIFCAYLNLPSQGTTHEEFVYKEQIEDPYLAPSSKSRYKSSAVKILTDNFFCNQVNVSRGDNILNDAANEPSIAINPLNSDEIIIGWRQFDNINSNFRQAGFAYSVNGGMDWNNVQPIEPGVFRSDPVLGADQGGRFYYNSLTFVESTNDIFCHTFFSEEIGLWDEGTFAFGGDKQWMAIGNVSSETPRIYLTWSPSFSICEGSFTQSLDGGATYKECVDAEFDTFLGTVNVGRDHNLYAAGWHQNNLTVRVSDHSSDSLLWTTNTIVDIQGSLAVRQGPNPQGLLGQVNIDTDIRDIEGQNYVYVLSSVISDNNSDPCDIMFARSSDGGQNFDSPIRINTDDNRDNYQWFGTMSVAPNGRIDVVWLDTRDHPGTFLSSLYYSYSEDHGETWSSNRKLTESFDPHIGWPNQQKMGDYFDMESTDEGAALAWCGTFNGEQDVYYSFIKPIEVTTSVNEASTLAEVLEIKILPNPSISTPSIEVTSRSSLMVELQLTSVSGATLGQGNFQIEDKQKIPLNNIFQRTTPLEAGVYFLRVSTKNHGTMIKKIIIIEP